MESYLNENFGDVKAKRSSHEVLQKWREVCSVVKNPKRRFRFTANLSKRYEADAMRKTNQGNNNSKNQLSENYTTVNRKRKKSASPAGRTENVLPILKKLESQEFDYLPTNEEVILTDLVDFLIATVQPPMKMIKKNISTPVKDEWEWEEIIAEEYNEYVSFILKEDEDKNIDMESTRKQIEELSIEPENQSDSPMMEVDEIQDDY